MHSCEGARTAKNKQRNPCRRRQMAWLNKGGVPNDNENSKCKGDAIVSLPMDWKKTSRANKRATVTSNSTNIAMLTTSWDPKDSFYDGHGAARSLSKCLPLKAGNTIFRNEYWTWPTHGPNNYELMDVVGMLGIVLWSHVTETSFSKRFSFPKRSDRQRQTTREPSKNMLWDPTARGMLKK